MGTQTETGRSAVGRPPGGGGGSVRRVGGPPREGGKKGLSADQQRAGINLIQGQGHKEGRKEERMPARPSGGRASAAANASMTDRRRPTEPTDSHSQSVPSFFLGEN